MTDELITDLAKISALRVISRTSVMQYRGTKKPIPQIARELNVDAVLEGTVTRDQGRVRITAQLIAAEPEKHLWADKYEASSSDVLIVQDALAKAVAHEIQIKLTPWSDAARRTPSGKYRVLRGLSERPLLPRAGEGRKPAEMQGVLPAGDRKGPRLCSGMGGVGRVLRLAGRLWCLTAR